MRLVTKEQVLKDYTKLKLLAKRNIEKERHETSIELISKASELMYNSNFFYMDSELEDLVKKLSESIFNKNEYKKTSGTILFYDYFSLDNRGLTEQYLNALIKSNYNIVYVSRTGECKNSKHIYEKIHKYSINNFTVINNKKVCVAERILKIIKQIVPEIILVHTAPWDVECLMALCSVKSQSLIYNINLTDHAFWLGQSFFDYNFEFRDYGCNISEQYRMINNNQLLKLPFYPIVNDSIKPDELPFNLSGKKLFLSGGNIDKVKGDRSFFDIVKFILDKFNDSIFLYLGHGSSDYFKGFIEQNNYSERFYTLEERKDIVNIFNKSFMYINTYPVSGGLMTQLACKTGKLPITLNCKHYPDNNIDELLSIELPFKLVFDDLKELEDSITFYVNNPHELEKTHDILKSSLITEMKFNETLYHYLKEPVNLYCYKKYKIDNLPLEEMYISILNEKNKYNQIMRSRNFFIIFHFIKYSFCYYINRIREYFMKK